MQSSGSYRLTVRQGPVPGKIFELAKDMMTLGRDVNNDLVINDSEVSRNHARLTSQSGGYLIEDLASTNGTFVNGQRLIGPKLLNSGDVVGLGETIVLEFGYVADAGATVIASAPMPMASTPTMMAEPPTAPPAMPMPEPMPSPTMAEPMMSSPAPMMAEPAPMMSSAPPPMMSSAPPPMSSPASGSTMGGSSMGSSTGSMSTPPMAPPPPPAPPKKSNRNLFIGIGCGCVTLCLCAGVLYGVYANLGAIMQALGLQ